MRSLGSSWRIGSGILRATADDGGVVLFLPGFSEPGADGFQAEHLQAPLAGFSVFLELSQQGALAHLLQISGLVRIGDVPVVFGLGSESRVVRGQVAGFFEVR